METFNIYKGILLCQSFSAKFSSMGISKDRKLVIFLVFQ